MLERIVGETGELGASSRIRQRPDGSADIDGLALVKDVNTQLGLHIDESIYTTIGGYVLGRLSRHPRVGDMIETEARRMRVEEVDGLRVARVWVSPPPAPTAPDEANPPGSAG